MAPAPDRLKPDALDTAERWLAAGRRIALATVAETWGSAPRPVGSHLVIDEDGNFEGSVSGGCVEGAVIAEAEEAMLDGRTRLLAFGVADETAWQVGLSCGGRISVLVRPILGPFDDAAPLIAAINASRRRREAVALGTEVSTGRMELVREDDAARQDLAGEIARALASGGSPGLADVAGRRFMVGIYRPATRLVLVGAVHITQALAPMAILAGLDVEVIDPRTAFATPDRFPGVTLHPLWPDIALPAVGIDRYTALAALTHDPKIDDPAIEAALAAGAFYVGALGSRKTHGKRVDRLTARGWSNEVLARIRAPIGIEIGARSPGEIAVAILAEIIEALTIRQQAELEAVA